MDPRDTTKDIQVASTSQVMTVKRRIETAIRMALAVHTQKRGSADDSAESYAIAGIVVGTTKEIMQTLGLQVDEDQLGE